MSRSPTLVFPTFFACAGKRRHILAKVYVVQNRILHQSSLSTKVCMQRWRIWLTTVEYDARLVDVWAAAVVFYCMQFQELPWRFAKAADNAFATFLSQYASSNAPPPLNNLAPRECRNVLKHMLDPDPKSRWGVEDALQDKWIKSIQVCVEGEPSNHKHVGAGLRD